MWILRTFFSPITFGASLLTGLCCCCFKGVHLHHLMRALLLILTFYISINALLLVKSLRADRTLSSEPLQLWSKQSHAKAKNSISILNESQINAQHVMQNMKTRMPILDSADLNASTHAKWSTLRKESRNKTTNTPTRQKLSDAIAQGVVLLRPALVGRLGNQLFCFSSAWGLSLQLQAAFGRNISVRPVIWREAELYKLFGDQLDAIVSSESELKKHKAENFYASNAVYDASLLNRMVHMVKSGKRGIFNVGLYLSGWTYFHAPSIDTFQISEQFRFPSPILINATRYISQVQLEVENRYKIMNQKKSEASYVLQLNLNNITKLLIDSPSGPIQYVGVHVRLTDHRVQQNSRHPNREFFILAAAHFFKISHNVL